jgi:hypothetical protein
MAWAAVGMSGLRVISWPPRRTVAERTVRRVRTMFLIDVPVASWRCRERRGRRTRRSGGLRSTPVCGGTSGGRTGRTWPCGRTSPISRKRGFGKTALRAALAEVGIAYEHRPELGNPKENRPGFAGSEQEVRAAKEEDGPRWPGRAADTVERRADTPRPAGPGCPRVGREPARPGRAVVPHPREGAIPTRRAAGSDRPAGHHRIAFGPR